MYVAYAVRGGGKRISPRTGPFYSLRNIRTPAIIIVICHQTPDIPDSSSKTFIYHPNEVLLDLQEINIQFSFGLLTNVKNTKAVSLTGTHDRVLTLTPGPALGVDTLT